MSCKFSELIRHVVIVSLTSNRRQNQAAKLTGDSYLEENVFSSELREHWKMVQEKGILSLEMHSHLKETCAHQYIKGTLKNYNENV